MADKPESNDEARARKGRRAAFTLFYSMVVVFTLTAAAQISIQVYRGGGGQVDCKAGLRELARSIDEAQQASEGASGDAEAPLRRFRDKLAGAWASRDAIERACKAGGDPALVAAFEAIERLRYAEESALRREGSDLVPLRTQVRGLLGGPLGGARGEMANVETRGAGQTRLAAVEGILPHVGRFGSCFSCARRRALPPHF